jgi:small subunit ribosomal protein S20
MANHASAEKRERQRVRRTQRNRSVKGAVRTLVKKARTLVETSKGENVKTAIDVASRALDKAAAKGIVHVKAAARAKSRLAKAAHKAAQARPTS